MSPPLLTTAAIVACPHGGTVMLVANGPRAQAGAPVLRPSDTFVVAGCAFAPGGVPSPCVTVQWSGPATQVTLDGTPALTASSTGLCMAATQAPQGPATVSPGQARAAGT